MRIGIDARYAFRRQRRGIGEYVAALLTRYPAIAASDDEFVLYVDAQATSFPLDDARFRVRRLGASNPLLWEEVSLPWAARSDRLDLLHLTSNYGPSFAPCPSVHTVHDVIEFIRPQFDRTRLPWRHALGRAVRTRTLPRQARRCRYVIADSQAGKADLVAILRLPSERVRVVGLGVDGGFRPGSVDAARELLRQRGHDLPQTFVLALGADDARKNGRVVIGAFRRVVERCPQAHLYVVGIEHPEPFERSLDSRPGWLTLSGYVPRDELVALLQAATLFVYPSLYEGFGLPVLEAMACGTPVAASDRTSIPEIVGDAGVLFDPGNETSIADALCGLLADEPRRLEYAAAGQARAKRFSWEETAARTYDVYRDAVGRAPARAAGRSGQR